MDTIFSSRLNQILVTLVLLGLVVALGAYAHAAWQDSRYASEQVATISVSGSGEAVAVPDIATFQYSVIVEDDTAEVAQNEAASTNNAILEYLRETAGVSEEDIRTTRYDLSPRYEQVRQEECREGFCPPGERVLVGYEVRQTVEVRVRDTAEAGDLVSGVGQRGASNITSLRFTIDDDSSYVDEARDEAIADAKAKAEVLADSLGVRLVRIVSYDESGSTPGPYMMRSEMEVMDSAEAVSPDLPAGEDTITRSVHITYEIR